MTTDPRILVAQGLGARRAEIFRQNHAAILHEIYTPWREHDEDGTCCEEAIKP